MPQLRKDNYHTPISQYLLTGELIKFHSNYCLWVYVYLKLWQKFFLDNSRKNVFSIDYELLCTLFRTSRTTLSCAVHELVDAGLLKKTGFNKFILVDENQLLNTKGKKEFVKIHNNHFMDMLNAGVSIRQLNVYYQLVFITHKYADENGLCLSQETQTSITKRLKSRGPEVKAAIEGLQRIGLVGKDKKGRLYVKTQRGDVKSLKPTPWLRANSVIETKPLKGDSGTEKVISINNEFYEQDNEGRKFKVSVKGEKFQLKTKEDYERELAEYREKYFKPFKDINEHNRISKQIGVLEGYIEAIVRLDEYEEICCSDEN